MSALVTPGRMVQYTAAKRVQAKAPPWLYPAIVTYVWSEEDIIAVRITDGLIRKGPYVNLVIFDEDEPTGTRKAERIPYDEEPTALDTWRWPPRE